MRENEKLQYIQEIIAAIENDAGIEEIELPYLELTDAEIAPLFAAIAANPIAAAKIKSINLAYNHLTNLKIPKELIGLQKLNLNNNKLISVRLPEGLTALRYLDLASNQLTSIKIPKGTTALRHLSLINNLLTSVNLPDGLCALRYLLLTDNHLTNVKIPAGATALQQLHIDYNYLTSLELPEELLALEQLYLTRNQLTSLYIPKKLIALLHVWLFQNPLNTVGHLMLDAAYVHKNLELVVYRENELIPAPDIFTQHFKAMRCSFQEMIQALNIETQRAMLSQLLSDWVSLMHLNFRTSPMPDATLVKEMLLPYFTNSFKSLLVGAVNPADEIAAMRKTFTFAEDAVLSPALKNALAQLDAYLQTQEGAKLIASKQKGHGDRNKDVTNFEQDIATIFSKLIAAEQGYEYRDFVLELNALFAKNNFAENVLYPEEILEIVNPLRILLNEREKVKVKPR